MDCTTKEWIKHESYQSPQSSAEGKNVWSQSPSQDLH